MSAMTGRAGPSRYCFGMRSLHGLLRRAGAFLHNEPEISAVHDDAGSAAPASVEVVTSLDRLDEKLAEIDAAWSVSDDAVRAVFATFRMEIEVRDRSDPWSPAYRQGQFDLYHRISARPTYSTDNEVSGFTVDPRRPFPYYTESFATVGHQLMAIGYIISTMELPSGSSILEFGPGWGNTTIALARMGYDVTALDIDPTFAQLIQDRAGLFDLNVNARVGAFLDAATLDVEFDAVLFYECFHHCSDHVQLLADLHRVVKPGGTVFLASEPIFDGFHAPWGLRLDGESLWAIRQNGWLELGFTESYFIETCIRQGWAVTRHSSDVSHLTTVFGLSRIGDTLYPGSLRLPPADDSGWAIPDSGMGLRYTSADSRLVCPINGPWLETILNFTNPAPHDLPYAISHGDSVKRGIFAKQSQASVTLPYDPDAGSLRIETTTWRPTDTNKNAGDGRLLGLGVLSVQFR